MAQPSKNPTTYVNSLDRPGNVFAISVYKPQGREAYASAHEGTIERDETGFVTSFSTTYGDNQYRFHRVMLGGSNTQGRREAALARLMEQITEAGWIAPGESVNTN